MIPTPKIPEIQKRWTPSRHRLPPGLDLQRTYPLLRKGLWQDAPSCKPSFRVWHPWRIHLPSLWRSKTFPLQKQRLQRPAPVQGLCCFSPTESRTSSVKLRCLHCGNTLVPKKDRKHFIVHKCVNPKCPYYLHNFKKVDNADLKEDYGKNKYKLHYIYREFTMVFFSMDLNTLLKNTSSLKFSKHNAHVMSLCLTLHVNLGLSLRKPHRHWKAFTTSASPISRSQTTARPPPPSPSSAIRSPITVASAPASPRHTNGFDNIDGANYGITLWVAYYNFLRPLNIINTNLSMRSRCSGRW